MPDNEVNIIYLMNKEAQIIINTPSGVTNEITVSEIVRQGTIYEPILCGISTDKVNPTSNHVSIRYGQELEIEPMIYVDDIISIGDKQTIIDTIRNCRQLELQKKITFNNEKSKYQILNFSKQKIEELSEKVKKGKIGRAKTYKYLGDVINEEGNYNESIKGRKNKQNYITMIIRQNAEKTGHMYIEVIEKLYNAIAKPMITFNTETWSNIRKEEMEEIEKIQKNILFRLYEMPRSTPYKVFLSEIGIWTIERQIQYKNLLFLHQLITSEENRIARKTLIEQQRCKIPKCWYSEIQQLAKNLNININFEKIERSTKYEWKEYVKKSDKRKDMSGT